MPSRSGPLVNPVDTARRSPVDDDRLRQERPSEGVAVITRDGTAEAVLDPMRRRVLEQLHSPGSASTVAVSLGLSRQRANYHVRALERAGLVEQVGERPRRGLKERIVRATAAHYVISPEALGALGPPDQTLTADRFSATFQVAVAARTIREVAELSERAREANKRLTTLTLDTTIRFGSPAAREAFANDLVAAINNLVAKHHDAGAADGREYRLFVGAHPVGVTRKPT